MPDGTRPTPGFRLRPWLLGGLITTVLVLVLLPVGCVGFTLYCWLAKGADPDRVVGEWKQERRRHAVETEGAEIMTRIRRACPEELAGWNQIPYRNDLAGQYYELLDRIQLQYDYRRPDGSDNISLEVVVNPTPGNLRWFEANPYLPDSARRLECGEGAQGWIHEAYPWNFFLPPYDHKAGSPKACMAQVFIGDWTMRPFTQEERQNEELTCRKLQARTFEYDRSHPEWAGPDGRIDPMRIPAEYLNPLFQVPSSHRLVPVSKPDGAKGPVYPHCIVLQIVGRDETSVRSMLARVDLRELARLTGGR